VSLLDIVLPVFLVIALGYLLRIVGLLRADVTPTLSRLVFYVAAPALIVRSIARTPLRESLDVASLSVLAGVTVLMASAVYLACWRLRPQRRGVVAQGAHRSNMVFMGLPVVAYAYGDEVLGPVSVTIGFMVMLYNFAAVLVLTLPHAETSSLSRTVWLATARRLLLNPLILACAGGVLVRAVDLPLPLLADRSLQLVGQIAMPLALLTVGADLDFRRLRGDLGPAAMVSVLKLILYPSLVLVGLRWIGVQGTAAEILVLVMASPTAVVSFIMAKEMRGDADLAGAIVIGTTAFSLLTYLGWLVLFRI